ncbi:hypothetical protein CK203_061313 [Vitis vinifera]|uniref:Uncharacterized protein n=1 Tax=Vitis vinifera TaxID=29760 RepID=A0A438GHM2_VITVI|nr:hypothetical protein CK203_061313 [Vitis vinifera]
MDPDQRRLLKQLVVEDAVEASVVFSLLMGAWGFGGGCILGGMEVSDSIEDAHQKDLHIQAATWKKEEPCAVYGDKDGNVSTHVNLHSHAFHTLGARKGRRKKHYS